MSKHFLAGVRLHRGSNKPYLSSYAYPIIFQFNEITLTPNFRVEQKEIRLHTITTDGTNTIGLWNRTYGYAVAQTLDRLLSFSNLAAAFKQGESAKRATDHTYPTRLLQRHLGSWCFAARSTITIMEGCHS